jgi:hypothetical protein
MKEIYIYGLYDPSNQQIRYIGKTIQPEKRLKHHLFEAQDEKRRTYNTHKNRWVRKVLSEGLSPELTILAITNEENWQEEERKLIAQNKDQWDLTNISAGGDGVDAERTAEWKKKIGDAHRGKEISNAMREKLKNAKLAKRTTHCPQGHEYNSENTVECKGNNGSTYRACRLCRNQQAVERRKNKGLLKGLRKTICKNGHLLEGDNLRILLRGKNGKIHEEHICRECVRIRNRKAKLKKKES